MAPVDGIRAPRTKSKKEKDTLKPKRSVAREKPTQKKDSTAKKMVKPDAEQPQGAPPRELGLWIIVGTIMIVIIAIWAFLFQGGKLVKPTESERLISLSDKVTSVWESIKKDVFQIKDAVEEEASEKNAEDEIIQDLRERVFPELLNKEAITNVNKELETNGETKNNEETE